MDPPIQQVLTLSGERVIERETAEGEPEVRYHVRERTGGSFRRAFTLPRTVKTEEIAATYEAGILTVRLPKAAEALNRRIEIRA